MIFSFTMSVWGIYNINVKTEENTHIPGTKKPWSMKA